METIQVFEVGDIVRCVARTDGERVLLRGEKYRIMYVCTDMFVMVERVEDGQPIQGAWNPSRFVLWDQEVPVITNDLEALTTLSNQIHADNVKAGWWDQADNPLIVATKIALIHSEVSEAMEGDRRGLMDDHLPQHTMLACELGDVFIRLADLAGFLKIDLGRVIADKLAYNAKRADHKPENRKAKGGKKY